MRFTREKFFEKTAEFGNRSSGTGVRREVMSTELTHCKACIPAQYKDDEKVKQLMDLFDRFNAIQSFSSKGSYEPYFSNDEGVHFQVTYVDDDATFASDKEGSIEVRWLYTPLIAELIKEAKIKLA